jgi:hypothetical protein
VKGVVGIRSEESQNVRRRSASTDADEAVAHSEEMMSGGHTVSRGDECMSPDTP